MKRPSHIRSSNQYSQYVVIDMETEKLVSDVLILFPVEHSELLPILRQLGYDEWADEIETDNKIVRGEM